MSEAAAEPLDVHLEIFEGPLDLLLYLIRKNDLDIYDIPISQITQEYLEALDLMKDLNLEVAGEFLVLASTLMQIKARMLLPSPAGEGEEEGPDPREELVARLIEYQRFKGAARFLEGRAEAFKDVHYRGEPHFAEHEKTLSLGLFDLLGALREVLSEAVGRGLVLDGEEFPVEGQVARILALLEVRPYLSFRELFRGETRKTAILSIFMALLEIVKQGRAFARQQEPFGEILIYKTPRAPVWPAGEGGPEPARAPAGAGEEGKTGGPGGGPAEEAP